MHDGNEMDVLSLGREVFRTQGEAILGLADGLGSDFAGAIEMLFATEGKVVISGMGKSGIIGRKIAATLSSTGTSSFFVHPGEAWHGDLGMFAPGDAAIFISYSGETEELIRLIRPLKEFGVKIVALVGVVGSTLGKNADFVLPVAVQRECCPHNLAPTTSTTAALVMGDAVAVALMSVRGFQAEDFARFHPGGSLGRRLLTRVKDVMETKVPSVDADAGLVQVIEEMTAGGLGLCLVRAPAQAAGVGIITDGDIRRALGRKIDIYAVTAGEIMSSDPVEISQDAMFIDAERLMMERHIAAVVAVDDSGVPVGILQLLHASRLN